MKPNLLFVIFISFIYFYCSTLTEQTKNKEQNRGGRIKRKVLFLPKAVWFVRLNGKSNILNYTTIFAHGWGFKITYELPTTMSKKKLFLKRHANFDLEDYLSWADREQFYHIMDQICKYILRKGTQRCGVSCKIQNIIRSSNGTDGNLFLLFIEKCNHYNKKYSQINLINHEG